MTDFEALGIVVDALERLSNQTIMLKALNESLGGECTRIMNVYSEFISQDESDEDAKAIWEKTNSILSHCNSVDEQVNTYKDLIKDLLDFLSNLGK